MSLSDWLSLAAICTLGAMSPGPSLALVMRHTLAGSRGHGVLAALAHGLGVFFYAGLTATGLVVVLTGSETLFNLLRYGGAAFLLYLGLKALRPGKTAISALDQERPAASVSKLLAVRDGFLIAFMNPKLAVFFAALFSQFVRIDAPMSEKALMALLAGLIDTLWYALVAVGLSHAAVLDTLRTRLQLLDRIFGLVLIAIAIRVLLI